MGLDYEAEKAKVVDTLVTNAGRPNEIWHARDGDFATFLRKGEAEEFAAKVGGKIISFEEAVASSSS